MEQERRAVRWGVVLILLAAVWRIAAGGALTDFLHDPDTAAFLICMGTGRVVRLTAQAAQPSQTEQTETTVPAQTKPQTLEFLAEESQLVELFDMCGYKTDLETLLTQPLDWELTGTGPTVLILHTHATESFTRHSQDYKEVAAFRTLDEEYNMIRVGAYVAEKLRSQGIGVIHDTTLHDYPSYTGSYNNSRQTALKYLEQYPSIQVVLDLHRDAAEHADGSQMATAARVDGKDSAQLMLVVGTDKGGLLHPNWRENMALGVKLQVLLEKRWPGVCRPVCFRTERFNQDLLPGALLVEVGAAGNTLEQALVAADCLTWALTQLAHGAN